MREQGQTSEASAPGSSTPNLTVRPGAPRRFPAPDSAVLANEIITQLRNAGADLAEVHTMLFNTMADYTGRYPRNAVTVLNRYFPNFSMVGVGRREEALANVLLQALA